ncbi:MAG TPA: 5-methyltetrahydrofolate--homocysteine methyltransferase [Marinagarivorans sp.]
MFAKKSLIWSVCAMSSLALVGCGDAKSTVVEKGVIEAEDDHDHDHDHGHEASAHGRLLVLNGDTPEASVYSLEDNSLLDSFALDVAPSAVYASGGYRYGILVDRAGNALNFIDGGLWQEDHVEHLHDYEEAPALLEYVLSGNRPTHVVPHGGQVAVFFDGDASAMVPASTTVFTDSDITSGNATPPSVSFDVAMHGAAQPRGEYLLSSWRRDDAQSTSANPILPDQVALYHWHDGAYEQEQIFDVPCPDLHGAAQNETTIVFGCSDGVLVIHDHNGEFDAVKIPNSDVVLDNLRIGSIYGHNDSAQFIGIASAHGGSTQQWFAIDPEEGEMTLIENMPELQASVVARGFSYEAEQFVILDGLGQLTLLEPHNHDGHTHWAYEGASYAITEADVSAMPEGMTFSMALAQNDHTVYVADPMAQHVLIIDLELLQEVGDIELDYAPAKISWLGITGEHH